MDNSKFDIKAMYYRSVLRGDINKLYLFKKLGSSKFSPINSDISDHLCRAHAFIVCYCYKDYYKERWLDLISTFDYALSEYDECYYQENQVYSGLKDIFDSTECKYEKEICNNGK